MQICQLGVISYKEYISLRNYCSSYNDYFVFVDQTNISKIKHYADIFTEDESDFCPQHPESFIEFLPPGCYLHGLPEVDVGVCTSLPCRRNTDKDIGQCSDGSDRSCCGAIGFEVLRIPCSDGSIYDVQLVTQCGCTSCP